MSFLLIEFDEKDGDSVAVVHQNWLTPRKKEVYWPPYKTKVLYDKAVKKGESCKEDWELFTVKRIFRYYESFEEAQTKAKLAEVTSDLQSEVDEVPSEKKRQRIKPSRFIYSSDTESEEDSSLPKIFKGVQENSSHSPRSSTSSCISSVTLCNTSTYSDTSKVSSLNVERSLESNADVQSNFQTKLVSHLALIIEQNKESLSLLKNRPIIEQSSVLKPNVPSKYLGSLDKNSVVSATNSALRCCLSYKVAKETSFLGSRNNKKAFNDNLLKKVIVDSVKIAIAGSTTRNIENCIKTWLKWAPEQYKLEQIKSNKTENAI